MGTVSQHLLRASLIESPLSKKLTACNISGERVLLREHQRFLKLIFRLNVSLDLVQARGFGVQRAIHGG